MSTRVFLVDDHAMFSSGLRLLFSTTLPGAEVVGEAATGAEALAKAPEANPDLVLLDLHLPDLDGIEVWRQLSTRLPNAKGIIVSAECGLGYVSEALKAGLSGYVAKTAGAETLVLGIKTVLAGKPFLCPESNAAMIESHRNSLAEKPPGQKPALSNRELAVLRLTAEGLRAKEIAERLEIGVKTVETYRRRLLQKLPCSGTADLVRYAVREGIVRP